MRKYFLSVIIPLVLVSGCSANNRPYNFVMDYPVEALRLSISGDIKAVVNCENNSIQVISDTSGGIFARHLKRRAKNICFGKTEAQHVHYIFKALRGPANDMLVTQPQRTPEF